MRAIVVHAAKDLRIEERAPAPLRPGGLRIALAAGGVCGSDLHYYNHGGFGAVRLREPMILGHEVSGHVVEIAEGVTGFAPGDLVAINPSRPCGACVYCGEGLRNHCLDMRFYGSAMPFPHIQGAFREELVADAAQCVRADGLSPGLAAMAEPLAVCLHAARRAGAAEIVATDLTGATLAHARRAGADRTINVAETPDALAPHAAGKGTFHALFECSGAAPALVAAIPALRPRGVILQLGLGGDMTLPVQAMTAKEIELRGCFRFHEKFETAVRLMQGGRIDPSPLITHTLPLADAVRAFDIAGDRRTAMKAQIAFS